MKKIGSSSSHLFLVELLIVILFFAFASSISLQVFAKAYRLAEDTEALNGGMMAAQSAAEIDKSTPLTKLEFAERSNYFDKDWQSVNAQNATYMMVSEVTLENRPAGIMASFHYTVYSGTSCEKVIFRLQSKKYYSGEVMPIDYESRGASDE